MNNSILKNLWLVIALVLLAGSTTAQNLNYVTTVPPLSGGNGSAGIAFNVGANKRVIVEEIYVSTYANTTVNVWINTDSISGPPTINAANGWTQVATGVAVSGGGAAGNIQQIPTSFNILIPAGTAYGFYIEPTTGGVHYTTGSTAQPDVYTDGTLHINTGSTVGYGGGAPNPTFHVRRFNGKIGYSAGIPCVDTPLNIAEVFAPIQVCPNKRFGVRIEPIMTGLTYQWQFSYNGTTWSNFTGVPDTSNGGMIYDSILVDKWYRCTIKCNGNTQTYTTSAKRVKIAPFYYCYCENKVTDGNGADIGNVQLINLQSFDTVINNGTATPLYNNKDANRSYTPMHDSIPWPCLYRDTTYRFRITQIHSNASLINSWVQAYIDYNRDGLYNPNTEKVFVTQINGANTPPETIEANFTVPNQAAIGETGMRIIISDDSLKVPPCDDILGGGEVEDYVVKICYRPCDGPTNAGTVSSTDTSMCTGYEYTLTNNTYEKQRSGFTRSWQISGDEITWFNIANSTGKDTLQRVFNGQPLYYRLRVVCPPTGDTTYSPATLVNAKPGFKCYCYSKATGTLTDTDTSDIGSIVFGNINVSSGGPHLLNPTAVRPRTDYTDLKFEEFFVDSTYNFYVYHTQLNNQHEDAKVTIFMDFNNNKEYDIPEERIYTGYTSIGTHTLVDSIRIPKEVITDVPTGARFIINNDIAPSSASDSACGGYTSGETEDFIVIFRKKWPTDINGVTALGNFGIHPNPNNGTFSITFNATSEVNTVAVKVINITGQTVFSDAYQNIGKEFNKQINISTQPAGVYFVEMNADGQKLVRKLIVQ